MTDRLPNGVTACPHGRGHNQPCPECRQTIDRALTEAEAHERLTAAAPDLLAALKDLWASITDDHECPWCDDVSWYGEGHGCEMAYIERLIAKATGSDIG